MAAALEDLFPETVSEELPTTPSFNKIDTEKHDKPFLTERLREDQDVVEAHKFFPSVQKFEAALWQRVSKIEEPSKLDKVLKLSMRAFLNPSLRE